MDENKIDELSVPTNQIVETNPLTITSPISGQSAMCTILQVNPDAPVLMIIVKKCKKCLQDKPLDQFRKQAKAKDKHKPICKSCDNLYQKQRYNSMKPYYINRVRDWQKKDENKEKVSNYKKKFKQKVKSS